MAVVATTALINAITAFDTNAENTSIGAEASAVLYKDIAAAVKKYRANEVALDQSFLWKYSVDATVAGKPVVVPTLTTDATLSYAQLAASYAQQIAAYIAAQ